IVRQYNSDYFPTVGATTSYSARAQGLPAANNFDVGLVITWPLFNGFLTDHQVNEAQFQMKSLRRALEDLRQQVYAQVKSSYLDWQSSLARIHRAQQAVEASNVQLELADRRYQTGLGSIIELTDAQRQYTDD